MPDYRETVEKLRNEVRGLRGCFNFDEWSIREAIGNTNYSVAMLHFQHIEESLALLTEQEIELARLREDPGQKMLRLESLRRELEFRDRAEKAEAELATLRAENASECCFLMHAEEQEGCPYCGAQRGHETGR